MVSLIDHPYIVAVRDVCRTNYHWYALLEYYNGGTLLDYIISHGRLKEHQARKFSRQLISALDYCHANGVIHGRVSIHNILISKIGDIKIAGFGETNFFGRPLPPDMKTDRDLPYFQAPELFKDPKFASPELDIYALGVVMHMLACGKVPFDDTDSKRFYEKVENGQVEFPPWVSKGEYTKIQLYLS